MPEGHKRPRLSERRAAFIPWQIRSTKYAKIFEIEDLDTFVSGLRLRFPKALSLIR